MPATTSKDATMTVLDTTAQPLSLAMKEGSQAQHDAAESSTFISDLMGGRVDEAGYVNYLRSLHAVYVALEEVGRSLADNPFVAALHDPALDRAGAIEADIAAWSTGRPEEHLCRGEAAAAYASRIRETAADPVRFVAHHYTRYLGDLSGGQAIGRILDREFGREGRGLSLYHFETIPKVKPYKEGYRARLDALPLTADQRADVVAEVQTAFAHNQAVFAELGRDLEAYRR